MTVADSAARSIETVPASTTDVLLSGFLRSNERFKNRPALEASGQALSYEQLHGRAAVLAATIQQLDRTDSELVGVFAYRSPTAYAGVLGALMAGRGYVPLNLTFPVERTRSMLVRAACTAVIVDNESEAQLGQLLQGVSASLTLILPHREGVADLAGEWPQHRVLGRADLKGPAEWRMPTVGPNTIAYVLFTSGSTGTPKGVMVTRSNVRAFIDAAMARYHIQETDRLSQYFDMTFDLSAFDMFMAWEAGACLCCLTPMEAISPGAFIKRARVTVWFSVPSAATFMHRLAMLKPNQYPDLKWSLFCGEALPLEAAERWQLAAPNSTIENLYGPTELTIACTAYQFDSTKTSSESSQGIVPIGEPLPGMEMAVVNEELQEVAAGEAGELVGTGPQLSAGYLNDPDKTRASFVSIPGRPGTYYRTGDRVVRPRAAEPLKYLGRIDNQMKVNGFRVEPGEIEAALRRESGAPFAVAVGWPLTPSGAGGVVAFLEATKVDVETLAAKMRTQLPPYMVPRDYRVLPQLPRNANGKVDRKALIAILEEDGCRQ